MLKLTSSGSNCMYLLHTWIASCTQQARGHAHTADLAPPRTTGSAAGLKTHARTYVYTDYKGHRSTMADFRPTRSGVNAATTSSKENAQYCFTTEVHRCCVHTNSIPDHTYLEEAVCCGWPMVNWERSPPV